MTLAFVIQRSLSIVTEIRLSKMPPSLFSLLAFAVTFVHGHGGIYNYTIDGVDYPG